ncbi:MAG: FMN-binding protein [Deltaproteobacteria bacterium]|nr:FMN-binding protein [Deltaproteobacteria bacterium]MBW2284055.1 FMN-binding protein [Deltaproteobacteria bacterium]
MKEIVQMIVVLSVICTVCGVALSGLRNFTAERIENQVLMNVQGPKVKKVLAGAENDLIADRKNITVDGKELLLFVGKKDGEDWAIAYETEGKGFGGAIKVMVGYDLELNNLTGVQIVSHRETPGIGSRVEEDQFTKGFKGLHIEIETTTGECPDEIDAISGATYSSKGVCEALRKSLALYPEVHKVVTGH